MAQLPGNTAEKPSCFAVLAAYGGPFDQAMHVMEILAANGLGLGEVLRDYAEQTHHQMLELSQACARLEGDTLDKDAFTTLSRAHMVLSSAATVLDMTPAAMLRNHADSVGGREKVSREEIVRVARAFRQAPEVHSLMQSEEACALLLQQALGAERSAAMFMPASAAPSPTITLS